MSLSNTKIYSIKNLMSDNKIKYCQKNSFHLKKIFNMEIFVVSYAVMLHDVKISTNKFCYKEKLKKLFVGVKFGQRSLGIESVE